MSSYTIFKVIKIIDEYSLVINGGFNDDISTGDSIEIYLEGNEIVDPFNENKILGTLDFIKDTLEVTEVYSEFAVCKKIVTEKIYHPSAFQKTLSQAVVSGLSGIAGIAGTTETKTREAKINIDESEITGRRTGDKVIRIGDIARIALSD
ncbi:hypothetical protein [Bacillus rhizoplanae]|uniref:hypothetical protein n=1 Tax=Bacillus rhizoplanae TaxID=2880966 RepID=UPI003D222C5A